MLRRHHMRSAAGPVVDDLVLVTGHAHFDLSAYDAYRTGTLTDTELTDAQLEKFLSQLPTVDEENA